jgi:hypothetical protein
VTSDGSVDLSLKCSMSLLELPRAAPLPFPTTQTTQSHAHCPPHMVCRCGHRSSPSRRGCNTVACMSQAKCYTAPHGRLWIARTMRDARTLWDARTMWDARTVVCGCSPADAAATEDGARAPRPRREPRKTAPRAAGEARAAKPARTRAPREPREPRVPQPKNEGMWFTRPFSHTQVFSPKDFLYLSWCSRSSLLELLAI